MWSQGKRARKQHAEENEPDTPMPQAGIVLTETEQDVRSHRDPGKQHDNRLPSALLLDLIFVIHSLTLSEAGHESHIRGGIR